MMANEVMANEVVVTKRAARRTTEGRRRTHAMAGALSEMEGATKMQLPETVVELSAIKGTAKGTAKARGLATEGAKIKQLLAIADVWPVQMRLRECVIPARAMQAPAIQANAVSNGQLEIEAGATPLHGRVVADAAQWAAFAVKTSSSGWKAGGKVPVAFALSQKNILCVRGETSKDWF